MATFKNSAFRAASIYDPSTGDVAQMNTLIEGTQFIEPEIIEQGITNGAYQSGWRFRVEFHSSDWDAYDQLRTFLDNYTEVRAVAAGAGVGSKNLQWYESVEIAELRRVPKPNRSEGDSHFVVALVHEGGENAAIFNNVNLLHQVNVNGVTVTGFVDGDADGLVGGYDTIGQSSTTYTFSSTTKIQTLEVTSTVNATVNLSREIPFPIEGQKFRLSSSITKLYDQADTTKIRMRITNFAETELERNTTNLSLAQRSVVDIVSSQSAYSIIVVPLLVEGISETGDISFTSPCLRTDGVAEFIAG